MLGYSLGVESKRHISKPRNFTSYINHELVEVHLDGVKPGIEKHNNKPQSKSLLIRVDSFSFYYGLFAQNILSLVAGLRCTFCLVSPNVLKFVELLVWWLGNLVSTCFCKMLPSQLVTQGTRQVEIQRTRRAAFVGFEKQENF